jgi:hypothetical protein
MAFISNGVTILDNGSIEANLGSMIFISEHTASNSGTIQITSGIDSTYPIYMFEIISMHPTDNYINALVNFSTDSGSNYNVTKTSTFINTYNYETVSSYGSGYDTTRDLAQSTSDQPISSENSADNDSRLSGRMYLFNPSSTTFVKHFMAQTINTSNPGDDVQWQNHNLFGGYLNTTSAVNGVRFKFVSGNIGDGKIRLYGLKDS